MTIVELALKFMHTCSSSAQDRLWNSEKYVEEERIEERIKSKSEKEEYRKFRAIGISGGPLDHPITPPDDMTPWDRANFQ